MDSERVALSNRIFEMFARGVGVNLSAPKVWQGQPDNAYSEIRRSRKNSRRKGPDETIKLGKTRRAND